ncbi:MAG TPA: hypothetical protein VLB79_13210 [Solirubrobacterales bacterium]|nr:hypothetical protein [Solirubrobacterales bacterium]
MKDFRSKIAVAAVIFGLGGLGGYAIASNPGHGAAPAARIAAQTGQTPQPGQRISTGTSGAVSAPVLNTAGTQLLPRQAVPGGAGADD